MDLGFFKRRVPGSLGAYNFHLLFEFLLWNISYIWYIKGILYNYIISYAVKKQTIVRVEA